MSIIFYSAKFLVQILFNWPSAERRCGLLLNTAMRGEGLLVSAAGTSLRGGEQGG